MSFSAKDGGMSIISDHDITLVPANAITGPLLGMLHARLQACDDCAVANVRAGLGGPFGASLHVYDGSELIDVAGPVGNAVLSTGLASAHAEDRVMVPENVEKLRAVLARVGAGASVYVVSSAESCPACHAKLEILARSLVGDGLLGAGRFHVLYGATYDDTREVAGFHDAPYHTDMTKAPGERLIAVGHCALNDCPASFRVALEQGHAVIASHDGYHFVGHDARGDDVIATAEISAIRNACRAEQASGSSTPWDLEQGVLYSPAQAVRPLMYAEAQWANISRIVLTLQSKVQEAADIGNDDFFHIVAARPYNGAGAAAQIIRLSPFENKAQHEWARQRAEDPEATRQYNGLSISGSV
jgi:hypothetical protein